MTTTLEPPVRETSDCRTREWSTPSTVDQQFVSMLQAFRPSGGLVPLTEVVQCFEAHEGPSGAELQGWISRRMVLCLHCQAQLWLPWFQFNRASRTPHIQLRTVLGELNAVHAPWEACRWFTPHTRDGARPGRRPRSDRGHRRHRQPGCDGQHRQHRIGHLGDHHAAGFGPGFQLNHAIRQQGEEP